MPQRADLHDVPTFIQPRTFVNTSSSRHLLTRLLFVALPLVLFGCSSSDEGVLARAAGNTFTVDEAAQLMLESDELATDPSVVEAVARLWVDYSLLAQALLADSTLSTLNFDEVVRSGLDQERIMALRDQVVQPDTSIEADELRQLFEQEAPGVRVRARHILLAVPRDADEASVADIRERAEQLRAQLLEGADFADLAERFSEDPGSASKGGDLGFFGRGAMVRPFEEAAFSLAVGEISEVVESTYGMHVIRVEEKDVPEFDIIAEQFRASVIRQRLAEAESLYISEMQQVAQLEIDSTMTDVVRQLARDPSLELSRRAAGRAVVEFDGGDVTVGDVKSFMVTRNPDYRRQVGNASDQVIIDELLVAIAQRELLLQRAEEAGIAVDETQADSVRSTLRSQMLGVAERVGVAGIEIRGSETPAQAVERTVSNTLGQMLRNERSVLPMDGYSAFLRSDTDAGVYPQVVEQVIDRVLAVLGPRAPITPPTQGTGSAPESSNDERP